MATQGAESGSSAYLTRGFLFADLRGYTEFCRGRASEHRYRLRLGVGLRSRRRWGVAD